jgi:alpha/beta superfamily hydrolase
MAVREEIDLFGGPDRLFGCRHVPAVASGAGVLVCLGAPSDGPVDEGRAARLGRRLAEAGVAVQRFHYRGAWPSDGDPRIVGFDTLVEDAARALDLLRDRADVRRVAFVGARLGALVAARVARAASGAAVALWAPVPDPRTALEQAARARVAREAAVPARPDLGAPVALGAAGTNGAGPQALRGGNVTQPPGEVPAGSSGGAAPGAPVDHEVGAPVDLFDTPLAAELAEGAVVRSLADELGHGPRAVLLAAAGVGERETIAAGCRARGLSVDVLAYAYDDQRDGTPVPSVPADELIDGTARWLTERLASGVAPGTVAEGSRPAAG